MWILYSVAEYGEAFSYGPFETKEEALKEQRHHLDILEEATKSLGHGYKFTKGSIFDEDDILFDDDLTEDGRIRIIVREVQPPLTK